MFLISSKKPVIWDVDPHKFLLNKIIKLEVKRALL